MKLGFIGLGNMGGAILNGILRHHIVDCGDIAIARKHPEMAAQYAEQGARILSNRDTAGASDVLILAVKPQILEGVLDEIKDVLDHQTVISIAAGWSPARLASHLPESVHYLCVMPNVPVSVRQGCTIINEEGRYTQEDLDVAERIFGAVGTTEVVGTSIYDACGTLAGCGPAFVFEMMEALCDAAVLNGIPKPLAKRLSAQMMLGSAQIAMNSGEHPCALKDRVCSPGGTTIEGIQALHQHGFHAAVMEAINAAVQKGKRM